MMATIEKIVEKCVGMRITIIIDGSIHDVNDEFASNLPGPEKISLAHRKAFRESKAIVDNIIDRKYIAEREIKRMIAPSFQAAGSDDEVLILKASAPGLYTA